MSATQNELLASVDAMAKQYSQPNLLEKSMLLVASIMSLGLVSAKIQPDPKRLKTVLVPDDWLQRVADAPDVSAQGLAFLSETLIKKRHVTVEDAVAWADIERRQPDSAKPHAAPIAREIPAGQWSSGAQALLKRARDGYAGKT